jgi:hypothetical protein
MQTRDKERVEEKRDLELENIVGNLLIAEYQVDRLRTRLDDLVDGYRPQMKNNKGLHLYSNTITNGINYHLESMKLISVLVRTAARKNRVSLYSLYGVSGKQLKEDSQNNMLLCILTGSISRIIGMRIQRRNGDLHPDMKG